MPPAAGKQRTRLAPAARTRLRGQPAPAAARTAAGTGRLSGRRALEKLAAASLLTTRGWALLITAAILLLAASLFGLLELYAVVASAGVLLISAMAWTRMTPWRIEADHQVRNARAGVGDDVVIGITLTNVSKHQSPALQLRDPVELGSGSVELNVGPLDPGRSVSGAYRIRARQRGVFRIGPLSMYSTDPFGLSKRTRTAATTTTVIVHPHVETIHFGSIAAGSDHRRVGVVPLPGHANDEFASLREYRPGDDLRRLHWRSTARTDTLMVREDQIERQGQVTVLVDLRRATWTGSTLERALSAAASIAVAGLESGMSVRLVTTAGADTGAAASRAQSSRILDELAAAKVHDGRPFASLAGRGATSTDGRSAEAEQHRPGRRGARTQAADGTGTLVVIGAEGTASALRGVSGIGRNAAVVQVVIEGVAGEIGGRGAGPGGAGGRVIRVGVAGLAAAWNQVST